MCFGAVPRFKAGWLGPALTVRRPSLTVPVARPLVLTHAAGRRKTAAPCGVGGRRGRKVRGRVGVTKAWSNSVVAEFLKFVKGLVALALCLGTIGATLAFVNAGTAAAAAAPTITAVSPVSGPLAGANKVTITGSGFSTTAANDVVDFGPGNPATISGTPTAARIIIDAAPAGSGPVSVTVTVSGVPSNAVTYTYAAAPTVTALYSASGPTSGGTTIIIAGNNFVGPGAVTAVDFNTTVPPGGKAPSVASRVTICRVMELPRGKYPTRDGLRYI